MEFAQPDSIEVKPIAGPFGPPPRSPLPIAGRRRRIGVYRWLLTRGAIVELLLTAGMIAVVWCGIWLHLAQQRQEIEAQAARDSGNLAQAAAESIGQTIAGVDDALRFVRAVYGTDPKHFDISAWGSRVNRLRGVALELALIDQNGMLTASSLGPVTAPIDFSDQEFYKAHVGHVPDQLFISRPILGRASGRWSVLFTRELIAADGWFMGVMAASVDPTWLTRLHQTLDIGHGALMLIGTDGVVRALAAGADSDSTKGIGLDLAHSTLLAAAAKADRGTVTWVNPVDGTQQIISFRRLGDYASIVAVGLNSDEVFAPYLLYARQYEIFGVCLTLLILITGCLLLGNTRHLVVSRKVLQDTMDAVSQGIVMVDPQGRVSVINRRASELLRIPMGPVSAQPALSDPASSDIADQEAPVGNADAFAEQHAVSGGPEETDPDETATDGAREQTRVDGTVLEVRTHALGDGGAVRTYIDVTERKNAEAQITHLALHDSLTGLPNRRLFLDRLAEAIGRSDLNGEGCAVLWIDLDRFKYVNDLHGHVFGDRVLLQVVDRLRGLLRDDDVLARFGGDEFCILQCAVDGPALSEELARRLLNALSEPYRVDGQEVLLTACVGIALCPADGSTVDELLTNADTALYRAKEGRGTFRLYEPAMAIRIAERRVLEQGLRSALALQQLVVFYQPIFDSATLEVTGFEALARWAHPTQGDISPADFISVAEESGLIVELGHWVMETACAEAMRWPGSLRVAVNLSPKQFLGPDLSGRVASVLAKTGLPGERLTLEVTEGVLIDNSDHALAAMSGLKDQGVRMALDDFGTGYSSLSYLRRFPFDCLKIDRSFVRTLSDDAGSQAIVQAILALGRSLRLKVVAEGVETHAQLQWLRSMGCAEIQGFLLGRPMPSGATRDFLAEALALARLGNAS
jgi:diguanylate cyclase (GGDEF)-like protein